VSFGMPRDYERHSWVCLPRPDEQQRTTAVAPGAQSADRERSSRSSRRLGRKACYSSGIRWSKRNNARGRRTGSA
jgi:hypothetical protein